MAHYTRDTNTHSHTQRPGDQANADRMRASEAQNRLLNIIRVFALA